MEQLREQLLSQNEITTLASQLKVTGYTLLPTHSIYLPLTYLIPHILNPSFTLLTCLCYVRYIYFLYAHTQC